MKKYLLLILTIAYANIANAYWLTKALKAVSEASAEARVAKEAKFAKESVEETKLNSGNTNWTATYLSSRALVICAQNSQHANAHAICKSKKPEISGCISENQSRFSDKSKLAEYCGSKYAN